jgi:uncharacterized protein YkwD
MRCMHNYARRQAGRNRLAASSLLARSSDAKSADILRCQEFRHTACGRSLTYHFHRVGYTSGDCWGVGENIAWGSGRYATVRSIMRARLHSDAHRGAILGSRSARSASACARAPTAAIAGPTCGPRTSATGAEPPPADRLAADPPADRG